MIRIWLLLSLLLAGSAIAHESSESYSIWEIKGAEAEVTLSFTPRDASRVPPDRQIGDYLLHHIVLKRGGAACIFTGLERLGLSGRNLDRFRFSYRCAETGAVDLGCDPFAEFIPAHVNLASVSIDGAASFNAAFGGTLNVWHVDPETTIKGDTASPLIRYLGLGFQHIFEGADHLLFLAGLTALCGWSRRLFFAITGFTLGHTVALFLVALQIVQPPTYLSEALIGLTILIIGLDSILELGAPRIAAGACAAAIPLIFGLGQLAGFGHIQFIGLLGVAAAVFFYAQLSADPVIAARIRPAATIGFGLIHGMGFANGLIEIGLPEDRIILAVLGFNLGVEAGQILLVVAVSLLGIGRIFGLRAASFATAFYGAMIFSSRVLAVEPPAEEVTVTGHSVAGYWTVTGPRLVSFDIDLLSGVWIKYTDEIRTRNICLVYDKNSDLTALCIAGVGRVAHGSLDGDEVSLQWWHGPANLIFRGTWQDTETVNGRLSGGMLGVKVTGGVPVVLNRIDLDKKAAAPVVSATAIAAVLDDLEKGELTEGRYDGRAMTNIAPIRDALHAAGHVRDIRYLGTIHNLWREKQRETTQDVYKVEFPDGIRLCRIEVSETKTVGDFDCRGLTP